MIKSSEKITIIGGGLVGPYLSILLKKKGFEVQLIEKRPDFRQGKAEEGRSINLIITSRGIRAFKRINKWESIQEITVPVSGRMMHSAEGELTYQPYGSRGQVNYSISRTELNKFLINEAEKSGVEIVFDTKVEQIDEKKKILFLSTGGEKFKQEYEVLIGSDGAGSVVRKKILDLYNVKDQVDWLEVSYKELFMPLTKEGSSPLDVNALHIWPRGKHMLMALPNLDGSFTMTLYLPELDKDISFQNLSSKSEVEKYFKKYFKDSIDLMPSYLDDFMKNKDSRLGSVRSSFWSFKGDICLIGDAAHSIVPFFGQGANAGLEDCVIFDDLLDKSSSWNDLFSNFFHQHKKNSDAIALMAEQNYIEMASKVGDDKFLKKKKIEHFLTENLSKKFYSRYQLVVYSLLPYERAYTVGKIQDELIDDFICRNVSIDEISLEEVEKFLDERVIPIYEKFQLFEK